MKQFKRAVAVLLLSVFSLVLLTSCGRTPLPVEPQPDIKEKVVKVFDRFLEEKGLPAMTELPEMTQNAENGLEPSVAYKRGEIDKTEFALQVYAHTKMELDELEKTYAEERYIGFTLQENNLTDASIMAAFYSKFKPTVSVSNYGMACCVYDGVVYVVMFMK